MPLVVTLVYVIACVFAGLITYQGIQRVGRNGGEIPSLGKVPLSVLFIFGVALLAALWSFIALYGFFSPKVVWPILLAVIIFGITRIKISKARLPEFKTVASSWVQVVIIFGVLVVLIWYAIVAIYRPPFGDADAFYMTYSKIIAGAGVLLPMPGNYYEFSAVGLSGELHFAALMLIASPPMAKLFACIVGGALLLVLLDITRLSGGGPISRIVVATMLVTSTTFSDYLTDGKTDLFAAAFAITAMWWLVRVANDRFDTKSVFLAGILCGFSLSAKFPYLVAFLPCIVSYIFIRTLAAYPEKNKAARAILFLMAIFILGVLISLLPHLIKNHALFDNAFAPLIGTKNNIGEQSWFSPTDTFWIVATYPIALALGLYPMQGGNLSFLWLAALPLIVALPKKIFSMNSVVAAITISALIGVCFWLLVKPSVLAPRYILAPLLLLFILPARAVEYIWLHEMRPRMVSYAYSLLMVVALILAPFSLAEEGLWTLKPSNVMNRAWKGGSDCDLSISSYCVGLGFINSHAALGERVFLMGYYSYWLRPDLLQCINEPKDISIFNLAKPENRWEALFNEGYSYVAIQKATHGKYLNSMVISSIPSWLEVSVNFMDSNMPVYHLRSNDPARTPAVACISDGARRFHTQHL